jgi:hypothetical protein
MRHSVFNKNTCTVAKTHDEQSALPSPPPQKIELHLKNWAKVANRTVNSLEEGINKVKEILNYFIDVADLNGFGATPAGETLRSAIITAENGLDPAYTSPISGTAKVSQGTRTHTSSKTFQLKNFVLENIPIFNIFDAMGSLPFVKITTSRVPLPLASVSPKRRTRIVELYEITTSIPPLHRLSYP